MTRQKRTPQLRDALSALQDRYAEQQAALDAYFAIVSAADEDPGAPDELAAQRFEALGRLSVATDVETAAMLSGASVTETRSAANASR